MAETSRTSDIKTDVNFKTIDFVLPTNNKHTPFGILVACITYKTCKEVATMRLKIHITNKSNINLLRDLNIVS